LITGTIHVYRNGGEDDETATIKITTVDPS
jgi:hypothetical protein